MKLNRSRKTWIGAFLGLGAAWAAMELYASYSSTDDAIPLTWLIVDYVPAWLALPFVTVFSGWLVMHFVRRYLGMVKRPK